MLIELKDSEFSVSVKASDIADVHVNHANDKHAVYVVFCGDTRYNRQYRADFTTAEEADTEYRCIKEEWRHWLTQKDVRPLGWPYGQIPAHNMIAPQGVTHWGGSGGPTND